MKQIQNFTDGKIFTPLIRFALPVLMALFLQTMYGAVDLLVVGQFGTAADVSAVSTGSLVMQTVTVVITSLAMGLTVLVGRKTGEGFQEEAGSIIGSGIWLFAAAAEYLKAYAIDTLLTAFLFCFIGYFNGTGATIFAMLQGIIGAFGVRLPDLCRAGNYCVSKA